MQASKNIEVTSTNSICDVTIFVVAASIYVPCSMVHRVSCSVDYYQAKYRA
jgi:hypothetical protein